MGILNLTRVNLGSVDVLPGDVRLITTDNDMDVADPGYLSNNSNSPAKSIGLSQLDLITAIVNYDPVAGTGTFKQYKANITDGVISLVSAFV